jgi:hypothetical protein
MTRRRSGPARVAAFMLVPVLVILLVVVVVSCRPLESAFGRRCDSDLVCGVDAPVCVDQRCVPVRSRTDAGDSCARPVPFTAPATDDPAALLRVASTFGDAGAASPLPADVTDVTDVTRSVVFALQIEHETGVRFDVAVDRDDKGEPLFPVVVDVRPLDGDGCGAVFAVGAAPLTAPVLAAGDWAVVVHGVPPAGDPGRFVLTATRVDCPVGYLPFDDASCVGFRPLALAPFAVQQPSAALVGGRVVVGGEQPVDSLQPGLQVFDPLTERWSMRDLPEPTDFAAIGALADGDGLVVGQSNSDLVVWRLPADGARAPQQVVGAGLRFSGFARPPAVVAAGDGAFVVGADEAPVLLVPSFVACDAIPCPTGYLCVEDIWAMSAAAHVCLCATTNCTNGERMSPTELPSVSWPSLAPRGAAIGVPDAAQRGLTFVHGFAAASVSGAPLAGLLDPRSGAIAAAPVVLRADITLGTTRSGIVVAGGLIDDAPASLVEFVDAETLAVATVKLPEAVVHPAVAAFAGTTAVFGGCRDVACAAPSSSTYFVTPRGVPAVVRGPDLPIAGGALVAVPLDDDRVFLVDGAARRAVMFEHVPRGFRSAPVDDSGRCPTTTTVQLPGDGSTVVAEGSIVSRLDLLRSERCARLGFEDRPEAVYAVELSEPSDVEVTVASLLPASGTSFAAWVFSGDCGPHRQDLTCGPGNGDLPALRFGPMSAGTFFVVVEAKTPAGRDGDARDDFAPFRLSLRASPVAAGCAPDDDDPDDDEPTNARSMSVVPDVVADDTVAVAEGTLCADDVDNLLYEHGGGAMRPALTGIDVADLHVRRAVLDDVASATTGQPVVASVEATERSFDDEQPEGAYVLTLARSTGANEPTAVRWRLSLNAGCMLDDDDSFVAALDDHAQGVRPQPAGPLGHEQRSLCFDDDVDVVPLPAWDDGRALRVSVAGAFGNDFPVAVHRVTAEGLLGAPVPTTLDDSGSAIELAAVGGPAERTALVIGPAAIEQWRVTVDITVTGDVGERCSNAIALSGAGGEQSVSLFGRANDVDVSEIGDCTGYSSVGPDAFFVLDLAAGDGADVTAAPVFDPAVTGGADISLYAFTGCPAGAGACIAGSDTAGGGGAESIAIAPEPVARTVFVAVDAYYDLPTDVELTWTRTR